MKKLYLIAAFAVITIAACNNDGAGKPAPDSSSTQLAPDNSGAGDTASYDRMSQKITDSSGK